LIDYFIHMDTEKW